MVEPKWASKVWAWAFINGNTSWQHTQAIWLILREVTKPLHVLSLVEKVKVPLARCPPLRLELQAKVRGAQHPL